ncbi:Oligopeptide-binding protein OppA precursor [Candidatus Izimaplasma bacterium HR1]|jgi:oligopeptide transport system substrate-binding protein|uniref:peptide ABC transporter substrate-binding protein n=1 Tax=Candidatus Izimoplasma sp. HR1 TaxID=1541959 RepID=UPI0004F798EB|nr:Oligopeptide-binding protein OppA precursor [Candidatus Izimaplasma bacterium HR1]
MKKLLVLFVAFFLVVTLSACTGDGEGVVLNWNIGADPRTLDPGLNGASDGGDVINNTFEGLVREKNGEVFPGMATEWVTTADGMTVTFTIREDAKWSDGTELDADDFVRSWLRGMDPRSASEYSWIWHYTNVVGSDAYSSAVQDIDDNDTPDDDTDDIKLETDAEFDARLDTLAAAVGIKSLDGGAKLEVKLIAPTNWFVSLMSFYHFLPVPVGATTDGEGAWAKNPELAVSNGPFVLTDYKIGESLQLTKNEEYWNAENVGIDVIEAEFIDLATTAYAKYYAGELDIIPSVPTAEIPGLIATSEEFHIFASLGTYYINFNLSGCEDGGNRDIGDRDNEIFCNDNLRQALALSIDRDEITAALGAGQVPAGGFIPPGFQDDTGADFYDTAKNDSDIVTDDGSYAIAVDYFAAAAADLDMTVAELQAELGTKEYRYNTSDGHETVAVLIQGMWSENLGFDINLANEAWSLFQATRTAGNFDMARGGWLTDFMDPSGMIGIFTQGNAYNDPDYDNAAFEAKLLEASSATTAAAHFSALYDAHALFMADMPVIPIYHYNDQWLVKSYVTGWGRSVLGGVDFSTAQVDRPE